MYNLTDMHLHSKFSWDAGQTLDEIAAKALAKKMSYICVTEHIDFMDDHNHNYTKFDYEGYTAAIEKARGVFHSFGKGIEAGEVHIYADRFEKFMEGKEFDYILGSLHDLEGHTPVFDAYFARYQSIEDAYRAYLEEEYRLIKAGGFDVAAHVTLVHRRGAEFFPDFTYEKFKTEIDDILKLMITKKIGLEVNTSGLRSHSKDIIPCLDTVKAYAALGGDIITIGSDGHIIEDTFFAIEKGCEMLYLAGVTEVCVFEKRKPVRIKLKK